MTPTGAPLRPALAGIALRRAIREAVRPILDLDRYQLFLFGSEVLGAADRRSDIDVGILGAAPLSGALVQQLQERLEALWTLRSFDVVDLGAVDDAFRTEALDHAERL